MARRCSTSKFICTFESHATLERTYLLLFTQTHFRYVNALAHVLFPKQIGSLIARIHLTDGLTDCTKCSQPSGRIPKARQTGAYANFCNLTVPTTNGKAQ